jgi:hypothetical protein
MLVPGRVGLDDRLLQRPLHYDVVQRRAGQSKQQGKLHPMTLHAAIALRGRLRDLDPDRSSDAGDSRP